VNVAIVEGRLSSPPRVTELGSGDVLVRYEVTVAREGAPADSVPVSWLGSATRAPATELETGDEVVAVGRVRRRWYRPAAGGSRSATEVVADVVVPARRRAAARKAIEAALAAARGEGEA
jgi:single-stranded DNA-binding protein